MKLQSFFIIETYFFFEKLHEAFNFFAEFQNYAVVKQRTKKNFKTNEIFKIYFRCDRGDKPKDIKHDRKRKYAVIRLIDCSFFCFALNKVDVSWILIFWDEAHNHEFTSENFHSALKKMTMTIHVKIFIETQIKTQTISFQILTTLRFQNDNCILKKKDIYNEKTAIRHNILDFFFFMQFLVQNLKRDNWYSEYQMIDEFHEFIHLFFTKENTLKMLKNNSKVLLMNCIYKINKFKLSLLIIVEQIFMSSTFYTEFAFISKKQEADYVWTLIFFKKYLTHMKIFLLEVLMTDRKLNLIQIIKRIFFATNHLLCIWHVNKNVLTNCKSTFIFTETWKKFYSMWNNVLQTKIVKAFEWVWNQLKNEYSEKYSELVDYLINTWIRPFAKKIIKCYISEIRHFMNTTTSRFEGAYRMLKQQLGFFIEDLKMMIDEIKMLLMN